MSKKKTSSSSAKVEKESQRAFVSYQIKSYRIAHVTFDVPTASAEDLSTSAAYSLVMNHVYVPAEERLRVFVGIELSAAGNEPPFFKVITATEFEVTHIAPEHVLPDGVLLPIGFLQHLQTISLGSTRGTIHAMLSMYDLGAPTMPIMMLPQAQNPNELHKVIAYDAIDVQPDEASSAPSKVDTP